MNWVLFLLFCVALLGLLARLVDLDTPLLEGAAGKQTHAAMTARNYFRGRASFALPIIDDIGNPGYFVKEFPLFPATVAGLYGVLGGVDERLGRLLSIAAWLLALPLLLRCLSYGSGSRGRSPKFFLGVATWFMAAPMGVVYSRAFMNDATMVAASLACLLALVRWADAPSTGRAVWILAGIATSILLKLHAALWLVPAVATIAATTVRDRPPGSSATKQNLQLMMMVMIGLALAAAWYVHAAQVHSRYPIPGATVAQGWIEWRLLLNPDLYRIIAKQVLELVLTPVGAVLAVAGFLGNRPLHHGERALLAWGLGVVAQSLLFGTRMFDEIARGTEYYQLPLVPVAAMLVGRGVEGVDEVLAERPLQTRHAITGLLLALLVGGSLRATSEAGAPPRTYAKLLEDCASVRAATKPTDSFLVLADRGGTVLYYCDRRGYTFTPAPRDHANFAARAITGVRTDEFNRALATVSHVYLPFPELLDEMPAFAAALEQKWSRVQLSDPAIHLYSRRAF